MLNSKLGFQYAYAVFQLIFGFKRVCTFVQPIKFHRFFCLSVFRHIRDFV